MNQKYSSCCNEPIFTDIQGEGSHVTVCSKCKERCKVNTTLDSFVKFCTENPELRFWQSLRAWSGADKIKHNDVDTFYWEGKNE